MKYAGYDSIVIEGAAEKPVYIMINNDEVEIRDAAGLWGKTTWETEDSIHQKNATEKTRILSIGPAGENLVRGACLINDRSRHPAGVGQALYLVRRS